MARPAVLVADDGLAPDEGLGELLGRLLTALGLDRGFRPQRRSRLKAALNHVCSFCISGNPGDELVVVDDAITIRVRGHQKAVNLAVCEGFVSLRSRQFPQDVSQLLLGDDAVPIHVEASKGLRKLPSQGLDVMVAEGLRKEPRRLSRKLSRWLSCEAFERSLPMNGASQPATGACAGFPGSAQPPRSAKGFCVGFLPQPAHFTKETIFPASP
eukprot:CAMPEP_0170608238 /NCGR_PEP_ID=MMETSP0224-20130122/21480_1 /TAXON_ID=285029 /ORGANISM="Togula jolla, Strain CCCM 725" /LENGTH=212 /DNA_ID=CAMNT_0010933455 /DNA_START=296 /DNA_END=937 /DNA_ORIENTATION=-